MSDTLWFKRLEDKKWHAYPDSDDPLSTSLCKEMFTAYVSVSRGAQYKMPKSRKCGACARRFRGK